MIYLPDTNAWISYLRCKNAGLVQRFELADPADIRLCSVVLGELIYKCKDRRGGLSFHHAISPGRQCRFPRAGFNGGSTMNRGWRWHARACKA